MLDKRLRFMIIYKGCHELRQRKHIDKRIVKANNKNEFYTIKSQFWKKLVRHYELSQERTKLFQVI